MAKSPGAISRDWMSQAEQVKWWEVGEDPFSEALCAGVRYPDVTLIGPAIFRISSRMRASFLAFSLYSSGTGVPLHANSSREKCGVSIPV